MRSTFLFALALFALLSGQAVGAPSETAPDGTPFYQSRDVLAAYEANEFAAQKKLNERPITIYGTVDSVGMGTYSADGSFNFRAAKYPQLKLAGLFHAYLVEPTQADLAAIEPGHAMLLLCDTIAYAKFYAQGKCQIVRHGPLENGRMKIVWMDEDIYARLTNKP